MNFYNNAHPYYCGIDLHARLLYVCIINDRGEVLVHKKIKDDKHALMKILEPFIGSIIVGASACTVGTGSRIGVMTIVSTLY